MTNFALHFHSKKYSKSGKIKPKAGAVAETLLLFKNAEIITGCEK